MKDKIKGLILGLILGMTIASLGVVATTGTIQKELWYDNIQIMLDNKEIKPTDVNGKYVEPFIIDGTTYLPVRAISNALGLYVDWDESTNTVQLSTEPNETEVPGGEKAKHFVVTTDRGYSPFEFQDAYGNIVGIDIEILAAVAEDQGFTYDLQYIGWDAAITDCMSGQADAMIAAVSITEGRKANGWIFSDAYFDASVGMAVAANSQIDSFDDLAGKTVAIINGTICSEYAESLKEQYDFEIVHFSTHSDMWQAIIHGKVDACFDDTPLLKYNIKKGDLNMKFVEGTEYKHAQYGMAVFDADNQEFVDLFNAGLKNIRANGTYDKIIAKYLE